MSGASPETGASQGMTTAAGSVPETLVQGKSHSCSKNCKEEGTGYSPSSSEVVPGWTPVNSRESCVHLPFPA